MTVFEKVPVVRDGKVLALGRVKIGVLHHVTSKVQSVHLEPRLLGLPLSLSFFIIGTTSPTFLVGPDFPLFSSP